MCKRGVEIKMKEIKESRTLGAVHTHTHTHTEELRDKIKLVLFLIFVFMLFFVFFTKMYPITIFDTDDWSNAASHRKGVPIWGAWNPIKVLPETSMGIATRLATMIILPFNNDFISTMTIMYATIVSLFILAYTYYFMKFIPCFSMCSHFP